MSDSTQDLIDRLADTWHSGANTVPLADVKRYIEETLEVRPAEHICAHCGQNEVEYRYREKPDWWSEFTSGGDTDAWDRWYCSCRWAAGANV